MCGNKHLALVQMTENSTHIPKARSKLDELQIRCDNVCLRYVQKVTSNEYHICYDLSGKQFGQTKIIIIVKFMGRTNYLIEHFSINLVYFSVVFLSKPDLSCV